MTATEFPGLGEPRRRTRLARERQHPADNAADAMIEDLREALPLLGVVEPCLRRIDLRRQVRFGLQDLPRIFVGRMQQLSHVQDLGERLAEMLRVGDRARRAQLAIWPQRLAVATRDDVERPARKALAR